MFVLNKKRYKFAPALKYFGLWCNGNTTVFGAVFLGSSPSRPTFIIKNPVKSILYRVYFFIT
jgi:hypothetical protein